MNLKKKLLSVLLILFLFVVAWVVVLQLTKQRIQLEATNKLNGITANKTHFLWDFQPANADIVSPYKKYWNFLDNQDGIFAKKNTNPILSLNFSGEKVNTEHFNKLQLVSADNLHGTLKLQIKTSHDNGVFYYSKAIKISGKKQLINLEQQWIGIDENNNKINEFIWPGENNQISSLVLHFVNPNSDLSLNSISLPTQINGEKTQVIPIDCQGNYDKNIYLKGSDYKLFELNEACFLPSNYMWLKEFVYHNFPGSVFKLADTNLQFDSGIHKVNYNYSTIFPINAIFYSFVVMLIIVLYFITKMNKQVAQVFKRRNVYSWKTAYTTVLGISILLLIVMSVFKTPNISTFELFPMYFLWAMVQQIILCYVLAEKVFYKQTQNKWLSGFFAAAVFSLFHLPSITLVFVTFIAGFCWAFAWLSFKRIMPLALSHTLLALMLYYVISDRILYSARVFHWFWE